MLDGQLGGLPVIKVTSIILNFFFLVKLPADLDAEQVVEGLDGVPIEIQLSRALRKSPCWHILHKEPAHPARTLHAYISICC